LAVIVGTKASGSYGRFRYAWHTKLFKCRLEVRGDSVQYSSLFDIIISIILQFQFEVTFCCLDRLLTPPERTTTADMSSATVEFALWEVGTWPAWFIGAYCCVIFVGLEILSHLIPLLFGGFEKIAIKGKHLDELSFKDNLFITINKCLTLVFVYHTVQVCFYTKSIKWAHEDATIVNTLGSLIAFYIVYDFFYANFHKTLHLKSLYGLIHKHHHRQKAPSRGNLDAINVHPFEFVVGEYIHLLTVYLVPCHIYSVVVFVLLAGVFASLNHTRFDVNIPYLFSVKTHDVHHRLPESNYSQYTPLWDKIMGTFRPYTSLK
jgi:sterol desaturase/sphingolipid hydroxylase (fatty acid hydroxylase superfamily)